MADGEFTAAELRELRPEIEGALRELSASLGITFTLGRGRYGKTSASFELEMSRPTADGQLGGSAADAYRQLAGLYGMELEWLGKEFISAGQRYSIAGILPRRKHPVLALRADGKRFLFATEPVAALMRLQDAQGARA